METSQKYAPLATGSLSGSAEALVPPETTRGGSNRRAFKIAGLTTLACLLLASQVFTAYLVFNQNQQIHSLQSNSENMHKELKNTRTRTVPAVQMGMPMNSMPLLMDFTEDEGSADTKPMKKLEDTALEDKVKDLLQNSQLPQFNETFLANLQSLKEQMEESEWKGFESWMRHWLIFQMAQQAPAPPTQTATVVQTECQRKASGKMRPGTYKPQCDEQGRYKPKQCHPSIGYCWCVDGSGREIPQTRSRAKLDCQKAPHRMMAFPGMMLKAFSDGDE